MSAAVRRRLIIFAVIPLLLCGLAYVVSLTHSKYSQAAYEFLAFLLIADLAIGLHGGLRNTATAIAAAVLGLCLIEAAAAAIQPDQAINTRGFSVSQPILGWGPSASGIYHAARTGVDGHLIYNVDYTIDNHLLRRTQSSPAGPTVAFFGDSFTFGQGLPDSETLPQIYADITGRKVHVLNFGFPGYGPQQFLRAMETGMFDPLLNNTKLFIYETGNWLIERSACRPGFMSRAPRYTLRDGTPLYQGACLEGWRRALSDIASGSSLFSRFSGALTKPVSKADVELYIAEFARSAQLVKQKYGGRLIILYIPYAGPYLEKSGFTDAQIEKTATRRGPKRLGCTSISQDIFARYAVDDSWRRASNGDC